MHPRTDFLLRSPLRLPYPRKQGVPAHESNEMKLDIRPQINVAKLAVSPEQICTILHEKNQTR